MINQPDQAKGFTKDIQRRIVVPILGEVVIRTGGVLAEEDAVRQLHVFPFPPTTMAGLTRGKEPPHLDDLPPALVHLARQEGQQFAERGIRERTGEVPVLEQPLEIEVFNANDPVAGGYARSQFVQDIIAQAGDLIVQSGNLPAGFLPILGAFDPAMEAFVGLTQLAQRRCKEFLVLKSLGRAQGCQPVQAHIDTYSCGSLVRLCIRQFDGNTDKPPIGGFRNARSCHLALEAQGLRQIHPSELRYPHPMIAKFHLIVGQVKAGLTFLFAFELGTAFLFPVL